MSKFDAIFDWQMTKPEAEAYKIALIWEEEVDRRVPAHQKSPEWNRRNHIPKKGDPRRGHLFKHCWKLRRSTRGLLEGDEYRLYILANITVLKAFNAYIEVNTICGDNAWLRWKIWKRHYDKKMAETKNETPPPPITDTKVARELLRTKRFIFEKCEGEPSQEKITDFVEKEIFRSWILQGKVSMYYVVLSPYTKQHVKRLAENCGFDPKLYEEKMTDDTVQFFNHEFSHELAA